MLCQIKKGRLFLNRLKATKERTKCIIFGSWNNNKKYKGKFGTHLENLSKHSIINGEGTGTPLQHSCLENPMDGGAWWAAVHGVAESWTQLSDFTFTFHFHALEKEMATHSSVLAWRIPGMGEPAGLPSMGSHRVRHDWSDLAAAVAAAGERYTGFMIFIIHLTSL